MTGSLLSPELVVGQNNPGAGSELGHHCEGPRAQLAEHGLRVRRPKPTFASGPCSVEWAPWTDVALFAAHRGRLRCRRTCGSARSPEVPVRRTTDSPVDRRRGG